MPQIIKLLNVLIIKQKFKREKDLPAKTNETSEGLLAKSPRGRLPPRCSDRAVAPPPPDANAVHPEPPRAWIRSPETSSLLSPQFPPLTRAVPSPNPNPNLHRVRARRRRAIAAAPSYPRPIAWSGRCAWVFSTSTPSHASRDAVKLRDDTVPFFDSGPTPSTIPATSGSLRPRRPPKRLRGERANPSDPFPLSVASGIVASVICRGSVVRRPPLPSFRSPVTIRL